MVLSPPGLEPTLAAFTGSPAPCCRWACLLRPFATLGAQAPSNSWPESAVPGPPLKPLPGVPHLVRIGFVDCGPGVPLWFVSALWTVGQVYHFGSYRLCGLWARCTTLVRIGFVDCGPGVPLWFASTLWTVGQVYHFGSHRLCGLWARCTPLVRIDFVDCGPGVPIWFVSALWTVNQVYHFGSYRLCGLWAWCTPSGSHRL